MNRTSRPRISIIGAGNVEATTAFKIAEFEPGDVVLADIIEDMPQGNLGTYKIGKRAYISLSKFDG